jgi:hypothetical protein
MTTHTHPEIEAQILELSKTTTSEIGASEDRLLSEISKIKDELESVHEDVKAIKDFLLPPKP